jgi:hypothetical protein
MQKLIIQDIEQINAYSYALRFTGPEKSLNAMNCFLRQKSKNKAYWDSNVLGGKGGWIVRLDFLRQLSGHFENGERGLVIADRRAAQKKISGFGKQRKPQIRVTTVKKQLC